MSVFPTLVHGNSRNEIRKVIEEDKKTEVSMERSKAGTKEKKSTTILKCSIA